MTTKYVNPGESIQAAINSANAGDDIIVRAGTYIGGVVLDKAVRLAGEGGAVVTLKPATAGSGTGVTIAASGAAVDALTLDSFNCGIGPNSIGSMSGFKDSVHVTNCKVYRSQYSCWIGGKWWLVDGNEFAFPRWWNGQGDCDYTRMFGSFHIFTNNWLHGANFSDNSLAPASGSDYAHVDGIQYYGSNGETFQDILVEDNLFEDFLQGMFICDEPNTSAIARVTVRNNRFISKNYTPAPGSANYSGRASWGVCIGKNYGATDIVLENNTLVNINNCIGLRGAVNGAMHKNVLYGPNGGTAYDPSCTTPSKVSSDNLVWKYGSTGQGNWTPNGDISRDPVFDASYYATAAPDYGWQLTTAPTPPDPTPEPTPDYVTHAEFTAAQTADDARMDAIEARIAALDAWKQQQPKVRRTVRCGDGKNRYGRTED